MKTKDGPTVSVVPCFKMGETVVAAEVLEEGHRRLVLYLTAREAVALSAELLKYSADKLGGDQ